MPLQTDPSVIYALKRAGRWDGNIRKRDLDIDSPYNTYRRPGLPPGPLGSPGREAILAVLDPARDEGALLREPQRRHPRVQRDPRGAQPRREPLPAAALGLLTPWESALTRRHPCPGPGPPVPASARPSSWSSSRSCLLARERPAGGNAGRLRGRRVAPARRDGARRRSPSSSTRPDAALVGKVLAALFAALAAGALFGAVVRRHGTGEGRWAGLLLALGTTLAAAAQAWSGEAAATCAVALARAAPRPVRGRGRRPGRRSRRACRSASPSPSSPRRWPSRSSSSAPSSSGGGARACSSSRGPRPARSGRTRVSRRRPRPPSGAATAGRGSRSSSRRRRAPSSSPRSRSWVLVGLLRALRPPARRLLGPAGAGPAASRSRAASRWWRTSRRLAVAGGWADRRLLGPAVAGARLAAAAALPARGLRPAEDRRQPAGPRLGGRAGPGRLHATTAAGTGFIAARPASSGAVAWDVAAKPDRVPGAASASARLARARSRGPAARRARAGARARGRRRLASSRSRGCRSGRPASNATMSGRAARGRRARRGGPARAPKPPGDGLAFRVPEGARSRRLELRIVGRGTGLVGLGESGLPRGAAVARSRRLGVLPPAPPVPLPGVGRGRPARHPALGRPGRDRVGGPRPPDRARERAPAVALSSPPTPRHPLRGGAPASPHFSLVRSTS